MPELASPPADLSLPQTSSTTSASPAITLPKLEVPDERFLGYHAILAGRVVVLEILSGPSDSRAARQRLWETYQSEGNNIRELGLAAQTLERSGINWRQARKPAEVLEAFRALPQTQAN